MPFNIAYNHDLGPRYTLRAGSVRWLRQKWRWNRFARTSSDERSVEKPFRPFRIDNTILINRGVYETARSIAKMSVFQEKSVFFNCIFLLFSCKWFDEPGSYLWRTEKKRLYPTIPAAYGPTIVLRRIKFVLAEVWAGFRQRYNVFFFNSLNIVDTIADKNIVATTIFGLWKRIGQR